MEFKILETPGHTPEHIVYAVTDHSRGEDPVAFSAEILSLWDVEGLTSFRTLQKSWLQNLFNSLQKLTKLLISVRSIQPMVQVLSLRQGDVCKKDEHDWLRK